MQPLLALSKLSLRQLLTVGERAHRPIARAASSDVARDRGVNAAAPRSIFAVFAHPDDEATWAGGALALYAAAEARVSLVTATRGEAGAAPEGIRPDELGAVRARELRCASRALGLRSVRILGYPDGGLADLAPAPVISRLAALLRRHRPDLVLTFGPEGGDGHPDHVAIGRFLEAAWRRAGLGHQGSLYGAVPVLEGAPDEIVLVPSGPYLEAKLRAARCHLSQPSCASELACGRAYREIYRRIAGRPRRGEDADPFGLLGGARDR